MANDFYCDDSYLQAKQEQEEQEYLIWYEEQKVNEELRSISNEKHSISFS